MDAMASMYKSVWHAMEKVKKDTATLVEERDKLV